MGQAKSFSLTTPRGLAAREGDAGTVHCNVWGLMVLCSNFTEIAVPRARPCAPHSPLPDHEGRMAPSVTDSHASHHRDP